MLALVHPVFDCLMRLTYPDALLNEEEVRTCTFFFFTASYKKVCINIGHRHGTDILHYLLQVDCLVLQLHRIGEQLENANKPRMDELFFRLRDGFLLREGLSSMSRLLLLEILEFRAGGWSLSATADKYYYSEISE